MRKTRLGARAHWKQVALIILVLTAGPLTARAQNLIGIADVGPQWKVVAMFGASGRVTGCQATSTAAPGVGAWSITETVNNQLHFSGGYTAAPPDAERGLVRLYFLGPSGQTLGSYDVPGAAGPGRFAAILQPDLASRQMIRDSGGMVVAGLNQTIKLSMTQMRQLEAILRTCVRHYVETAGRMVPGSDQDVQALMAKMDPLLGGNHTLVQKSGGAAPRALTRLQAGSWMIEPWQNPQTRKIVGCGAVRRDAEGRVWTFVLTPDLDGVLSIGRPGMTKPARFDSDRRIGLEFHGVKQGGKFFRDTDSASYRNPELRLNAEVGTDYVFTAFPFDSYTQAGFVRAETFQIKGAPNKIEMDVADQDMALAALYQCLRASFTPEGVNWPTPPSKREMQVMVARIVGTKPDNVEVGKRLQSIEPAVGFQWDQLIGYMSLFDPAHSPPVSKRIEKAQNDYLGPCYKKRRNQVMSWSPDPGIDQAGGVQMECDEKGHISYRTEIVATRGGTGVHLVVEAFSVHSAHQDVSRRMRQLSQRAKDVVSDFVLHRTAAHQANAPAPVPPQSTAPSSLSNPNGGSLLDSLEGF